MDSKFVEDVKGAKAAGLMVGAYWDSDAFNGSEAREEVSFIAQFQGRVEGAEGRGHHAGPALLHRL